MELSLILVVFEGMQEEQFIIFCYYDRLGIVDIGGKEVCLLHFIAIRGTRREMI